MDTKTHWDKIYETKPTTEVSWYQAQPYRSLELIQRVCRNKSAQIIDIGGGASTLVDHLLNAGLKHITVLDIIAEDFADRYLAKHGQ